MSSKIQASNELFSQPLNTSSIPLAQSTIPNIDEFQNIILEYYNEWGRDFPWRHTKNPYEILVSEYMLQQTQTERVVSKYIQWLERFPTVQTLAIAPLKEVLFYWSGLGYNRRAKFLHEAAKILAQKQKKGEFFPKTPLDLQKLPGVGTYTSCAIATFAFNQPETFIETNIRSVFLFFFFPNQTEIHDNLIFPLIKETLYYKNPRKWYYALMDYGAALKKKIVNPNRKSTHYTKQSTFKGSHRQARGAILRQLTQIQTGETLNVIAKNENIAYERLEKAAISLCAEKVITYNNGKYFISE